MWQVEAAYLIHFLATSLIMKSQAHQLGLGDNEDEVAQKQNKQNV